MSEPKRVEVLGPSSEPILEPERHCPVCGAEVITEKCKVVCRSEHCIYRIIYTCSEF